MPIATFYPGMLEELLTRLICTRACQLDTITTRRFAFWLGVFLLFVLIHSFRLLSLTFIAPINAARKHIEKSQDALVLMESSRSSSQTPATKWCLFADLRHLHSGLDCLGHRRRQARSWLSGSLHHRPRGTLQALTVKSRFCS
jgi:hypothetical protein